jgi:hypothetical protein
MKYFSHFQMKKIIDLKKLPKAFVDVVTYLLFILSLIYTGLASLIIFIAWFGEKLGLPDYGHPTNFMNVFGYSFIFWALLIVFLIDLSGNNLVQKYFKGNSK